MLDALALWITGLLDHRRRATAHRGTCGAAPECALCEATARVWHREAGTPSSVPEPVVIAPEGELDLYSVDAVVAHLDDAAAADCPHLILDLSAVTLVDSTALGAIIQVQHRFNRQGRKLSVVAPGGSAVAVLLELSGLRSHFSLFGSRDAALA